MKEQMLENSVIVVAHPDDEILWFSSILSQVDKIIFSMVDSQSKPQWGSARRNVISQYPLPNLVSLDLIQADTFGQAADWANPVLTEYGIALSKRTGLAGRYQKNYNLLRQHLKLELPGYTNVFTHNPWGEYGHEEHIQVYRVVKDLQKELKFNLWYTNYCSNRSYPLMIEQKTVPWIGALTLKTDRIQGLKIMHIYQNHNCWTWYPEWVGFNEESFICECTNDNIYESKPGDFFPINFIRIPSST